MIAPYPQACGGRTDVRDDAGEAPEDCGVHGSCLPDTSLNAGDLKLTLREAVWTTAAIAAATVLILATGV
ncbi:hypothetical protein [Limobrevibacterium gyesilva]|uniref:Uncharacterized protein n=1 Tax=Limobrevibacterium gyesilva TaxID=2991712 RepID=A0AA41YPF5_9PROT|nr:hypothetical protein [Limobrevibacterium gyesilva]MCW3476107.1 hypothetical protein [Limobrevibacterium gyesilva]